jgi:protein arginine kinase
MMSENKKEIILENLLKEPLSPWMKGGSKPGEIVLSSRIRLARNLTGIPFPSRADKEELLQIVSQLRPLADALSSADCSDYAFIELSEMTPNERQILVEKHIISPQHVCEAEHRAVIIRRDAAVSIMINEEDHLRLQVMKGGYDLDGAMAKADTVDDSVEVNYRIAFNERLGFLTACPTNLGTALRASVMLHLPALTLTGHICRVVAIASQTGLVVRGLYGEGTEAVGNIFQISNQVTLGQTEEEIIDNLKRVVAEIVDKEKYARELLASDAQNALSDRVWRAYAILRYAREISGREALTKLSEMRLGIDLGLLPLKCPEIFNELLVKTRPNVLKKITANYDLSKEEINRVRSDVIRKEFESKEGVEYV